MSRRAKTRLRQRRAIMRKSETTEYQRSSRKGSKNDHHLGNIGDVYEGIEEQFSRSGARDAVTEAEKEAEKETEEYGMGSNNPSEVVGGMRKRRTMSFRACPSHRYASTRLRGKTRPSIAVEMHWNHQSEWIANSYSYRHSHQLESLQTLCFCALIRFLKQGAYIPTEIIPEIIIQDALSELGPMARKRLNAQYTDDVLIWFGGGTSSVHQHDSVLDTSAYCEDNKGINLTKLDLSCSHDVTDAGVEALLLVSSVSNDSTWYTGENMYGQGIVETAETCDHDKGKGLQVNKDTREGGLPLHRMNEFGRVWNMHTLATRDRNRDSGLDSGSGSGSNSDSTSDWEEIDVAAATRKLLRNTHHSNFLGLRHAELSFCKDISARTVILLNAHAPNLEYLGLAGLMDSVLGEEVCQLLASSSCLPRLKCLDFSYSEWLTRADLVENNLIPGNERRPWLRKLVVRKCPLLVSVPEAKQGLVF